MIHVFNLYLCLAASHDTPTPQTLYYFSLLQPGQCTVNFIHQKLCTADDLAWCICCSLLVLTSVQPLCDLFLSSHMMLCLRACSSHKGSPQKIDITFDRAPLALLTIMVNTCHLWFGSRNRRFAHWWALYMVASLLYWDIGTSRWKHPCDSTRCCSKRGRSPGLLMGIARHSFPYSLMRVSLQ